MRLDGWGKYTRFGACLGLYGGARADAASRGSRREVDTAGLLLGAHLGGVLGGTIGSQVTGWSCPCYHACAAGEYPERRTQPEVVWRRVPQLHANPLEITGDAVRQPL